MSLGIPTFINGAGNVFYKAITHPLCAPSAGEMLQTLSSHQRIVVYDPEGRAADFDRVHPLRHLAIGDVLVQQATRVGEQLLGRKTRPITDLDSIEADALLITAFDAGRHAAHIEHLTRDRMEIFTLDAMRLPDDWISRSDRYLSAINFVTNLATFRDDAERHTRLVTANYWSGYGATAPRLRGLLFDQSGEQIASIDRPLAGAGSSVTIDSTAIREAQSLDAFDGQLFLHVTGAAGHDVLKYALDTWGGDDLSCTHDANAWPSLRYGGLPTPRNGERVILLVQNSHPITVPAGELALRDPAGQAVQELDFALPPFASREVDVAAAIINTDLTDATQLQLLAGGHLVRPRYEVQGAGGRRRIAHLNVIREDLQADADYAAISDLLGDGYLLPAPLLDPELYRSEFLVTPMSAAQKELGLRVALRRFDGECVEQRSLGLKQANSHEWTDVSELAPSGGGHLVLSHQPEQPGVVDGWFHAIFRYTHLASGHAAETSFGCHLFNGLLTYRGEPQSYAGPPPGLSTRLFLRLGDPRWQTECQLIYPSSTHWQPHSRTEIRLMDSVGKLRDQRHLKIPLNGSVRFSVAQMFGKSALESAGANCWVMIRDPSCRLFGYHGLAHEDGRFSLDHMFGF
jgi:hypothetical protein